MGRTIAIGAAVAALLACAPGASAADDFTVKLRWRTQAQFAGYYVALEKGYYAEAGLDVAIVPGSPLVSPIQALADGEADVIVDWMPAALAGRERGVPLVNIAQFFARPGTMLTCRKDSGVSSPGDLAGKTVGVWFFGNEYSLLLWLNRLGLSLDGGPDGVDILQQELSVEPLLSGEAACISTMSYNEYWRVIDGGLYPDDLVVFRYGDEGIWTLEDGLYALRDDLRNPAFADRAARFLRATIRGWEHARAHQDEAVEIVLQHDLAGDLTRRHQRRMMDEVARLLGDTGELGRLDPDDYERTVDTLLGIDPSPLGGRPADSWTHRIWEMAR